MIAKTATWLDRVRTLSLRAPHWRPYFLARGKLNHQVCRPIEVEARSRRHHRGRAVLGDDGGPAQAIAGFERIPVEDGGRHLARGKVTGRFSGFTGAPAFASLSRPALDIGDFIRARRRIVTISILRSA